MGAFSFKVTLGYELSISLVVQAHYSPMLPHGVYIGGGKGVVEAGGGGVKMGGGASI